MASQLETSRLSLRAYTPLDIDHLAALYADPDVTAFTKLGRLTRAQAEATLAGYLADWRDKPFGMCAAVLKASGEFTGECGLFWLERSDEPALRYAFHKRFWGRGLAGEAASAVIDHAFRLLGLERLVSYVEAPNEASHRVMGKLGLKAERIAQTPKGALHVYVVTAERWLDRR